MTRPRQFRPFVVRFDDWTAYRMQINAYDEQDAVTRAQAMSTGALWEAEAIDGGQEGWEAFPLAKGSRRGSP